MSRRLAADLSLRGQLLHSNARDCDPEKPGGFRRQLFERRRFEEAVAKPKWLEGHRLPFLNRSENPDVRNLVKKNAFIDSYYPKIKGEFSEDSRKSRSSLEELQKTAKDIIKNDFLRNTMKKLNARHYGTGMKFMKNKPKFGIKFQTKASDSGTVRACKGSNTTVATSTHCPTLDSKTYTLVSNTDVDSTLVNYNEKSTHAANSTKDKARVPAQGRRKASKTNEGKQQESKKTCEERAQPWSPAVYFAQLYQRIETLENLLKQSLEKSVQTSEIKYLEMSGASERPRRPKNKFSSPKSPITCVPRERVPTPPPASKTTDELFNSDTENELRSIRRRLGALEKKLKKAKKLPPPVSTHDSNMPKPPKKAKSKSFHRRVEEGDACAESVTPKNPNRKNSAGTLCSERQGCCFDGALSRNVESREKTEKKSDQKTTGAKVKNKIVSKCIRIKSKCSSMITSGKKSLADEASTSNEVLREAAPVKESDRPGSNKTKKSASVFYIKCHNKQPLQSSTKLSKRKQVKRKKLRKKISKTNIFTGLDLDLRTSGRGARDSTRDADASETLDPGPCSGDSVGDCHSGLLRPFRTYVLEAPSGNHVGRAWRIWQDPAREENKQEELENPLEILKRGGKIKIPVLFEEVCKTSGSKKLAQSNSDVSMRFVVLEDAATPFKPLKKLIRKLSQTKPPNQAEQFVFGVTKCCCDIQLEGMGSASENSGFG